MLIKYILNALNPFHKPKFSVGDEILSLVSNTVYRVESVSEKMYDLQPIYGVESNTVIDLSYTYSESINYVDATFKIYKKEK